MIRRALSILAGLFLLLVAIILLRTCTYGGPVATEAVDLPNAPAISAKRAADHLSEAIQFRTITLAAGDPRPGQEGPWLALHDWLATTYPAAHSATTLEKVADLSLLYTWAGSDPSLQPIMLMAHQDVVPVNIGTEGDWAGSPFAGEIIDGYVYGRGALDDKGSLVAIMEAAEALAASGFQPKRTIYLAFGHDEEVAGRGAETIIETLKQRDVRLEMALDEGFMIIEDSPLTGGPMGIIGVSEKGYVTLEVTATAAGGHSSMPPRDSAVVRLSRAILALETEQMPAHFDASPVKELFAATAADMPFLQRMAFANLWLFGGMVDGQMSAIPAANAMIRTTTAPTMVAGSAKENVLAQRAVGVVNFRVHPNDKVDDVLAHARRLTQNLDGVTVDLLGDGIGSEASPVSATNNRAYAVLAAVADRASDGAPVAPGLVLGATDARFATEIADSVYRFMPASVTSADLAGFHGTNERMSVENMGRMAQGYAEIMMTMGGG